MMTYLWSLRRKMVGLDMPKSMLDEKDIYFKHMRRISILSTRKNQFFHLTLLSLFWQG